MTATILIAARSFGCLFCKGVEASAPLFLNSTLVRREQSTELQEPHTLGADALLLHPHARDRYTTNM